MLHHPTKVVLRSNIHNNQRQISLLSSQQIITWLNSQDFHPNYLHTHTHTCTSMRTHTLSQQIYL